jgi:hypothetical protein
MGQAGNVASNVSSGAQGYFGNAANYMANVSGSMANASQLANASTVAYDPQSYQSYMNPYQQEVIDKYAQEMQRQFGVSQQNRAAQAIGAGALVVEEKVFIKQRVYELFKNSWYRYRKSFIFRIWTITNNGTTKLCRSNE